MTSMPYLRYKVEEYAEKVEEGNPTKLIPRKVTVVLTTKETALDDVDYVRQKLHGSV